MQKVILKIGGMSCSACSSSLEKYLNKQEGVKASVNLVMAEASIEYADKVKISDLERYVKEAGFESLGVFDPLKEEKEKQKHEKYQKNSLIFFGIWTFIILYISMGYMLHLPIFRFLRMDVNPLFVSFLLLFMTIFILIWAKDIFKSGILKLIHKTPNMDTLVTCGVLASFSYSIYSLIMLCFNHLEYIHNIYFESSAVVIFFIKLGRYIDINNREKTKKAISELVQITPTKALLKVKDEEVEIDIDEVKENDILIVKPGMKIAVDGVVTVGSSHLDESFLTGESVPAKKKVNDNVLAGSINIDGYLQYKALKIGKNSTISEIVHLVLEATSKKPPIQALADKICGYFVPTIMLISLLTFLGHLLIRDTFAVSLTSCVAVLVVACPCALGLATPLAVVTSLGTAIKNGLLIKSSETFEKISAIKTIVFDKTGTLTYGNLKIAKIYNYSKLSNNDLLKIATSLENLSTHPIAKAFMDYSKEHNMEIKTIKDFKNIEGIGLSGVLNKKKIYVGNNKLFSELKIKNKYAQDEKTLSLMGSSIVYIIEDKEVLGLVGVSDIIRSEVKEVIEELEKMNKEVIMLTGDNEKTAKIIADSLNIKNVIANVMPKDKAKVIEELEKNNKKVMMIGDGINDAPSLTLSSIGVSMHSGTDIAMDSADVILMHDDLRKIVGLIKLSERTLKNIKENLFWTFFYNLLMIPIATNFLRGVGLTLNPMFASLAMTISSLTVVFNALRLKKWQDD